jgi:hypothetical protein
MIEPMKVQINFFKKIILVLLCILLFSTQKSFAQSPFSIHGKIGTTAVFKSGFADINNGEAYILQTEYGPNNPRYFGIELSKGITKKLSFSLSADFTTSTVDEYELLTNSYAENQRPYKEIHVVDQAPFFISPSLKYELNLTKSLRLYPMVGFGIRYLNRGERRIIRSNRIITNQLEEIMIGFEDSFKRSTDFINVGFQISYYDFSVEVLLRPNVSESSTNQLSYSGTTHRTSSSKTFIFFGLGYKVW